MKTHTSSSPVKVNSWPASYSKLTWISVLKDPFQVG
jgi:hypothetical protein